MLWCGYGGLDWLIILRGKEGIRREGRTTGGNILGRDIRLYLWNSWTSSSRHIIKSSWFICFPCQSNLLMELLWLQSITCLQRCFWSLYWLKQLLTTSSGLSNKRKEDCNKKDHPCRPHTPSDLSQQGYSNTPDIQTFSPNRLYGGSSSCLQSPRSEWTTPGLAPSYWLYYSRVRPPSPRKSPRRSTQPTRSTKGPHQGSSHCRPKRWGFQNMSDLFICWELISIWAANWPEANWVAPGHPRSLAFW